MRATDVTSTSVTIEWDPVPCLERNAEILGYGVDIGFSGLDTPFENRLSEDGVSIKITGLTSEESYFFAVYAVGAGRRLGQAIRGQSSSPVVVRTLAGKVQSNST